MTCVIGLLDQNGDIYMGADSAGVAGYSLQIRADKKIGINGDYIMGFTGSFRMGQLLLHGFNPPKINNKKDLYIYMVTDFINAVRKCLLAGGFAQKKDEVEKGGTFIVGYQSKLFCIENDYQVGMVVDNFMACGCGKDIALGCLASTEGIGYKPKDRILIALECAEKYNAGVRSPFHIDILKNKKG
jgi:hypothetical protein